jgi:hypothetical protein
MPKNKDIHSALIPAVADLGGVVLGAGLSSALSPVGAAVVGSLTSTLAKALDIKRERRWQRFVQVYVAADGDIDPGVAEATLHAFSEDPDVQEAVLEAVRGIDEALADVVVPALARLTRLYTSTRRPADSFFRGMRRLLQDLNDAAFTELLVFLRSFKANGASSIREVDSEVAPFNTPNMGHILYLLKANALAADEVGVRLGSSHGPVTPVQRAAISRSRALQILVVVDSAEELRWLS